MQLLHDSNIQLLLRNQDFDISPPQRRWQTRVEQGLRQGAAPQGKAFYSAFTGAVAALNTGRDAQSARGQATERKTSRCPSCLFETRFRFLDGRVFFQCGLQNSFKCDGIAAGRNKRHNRQRTKPERRESCGEPSLPAVVDSRQRFRNNVSRFIADLVCLVDARRRQLAPRCVFRSSHFRFLIRNRALPPNSRRRAPDVQEPRYANKLR